MYFLLLSWYATCFDHSFVTARFRLHHCLALTTCPYQLQDWATLPDWQAWVAFSSSLPGLTYTFITVRRGIRFLYHFQAWFLYHCNVFFITARTSLSEWQARDTCLCYCYACSTVSSWGKMSMASQLEILLVRSFILSSCVLNIIRIKEQYSDFLCLWRIPHVTFIQTLK